MRRAHNNLARWSDYWLLWVRNNGEGEVAVLDRKIWFPSSKEVSPFSVTSMFRELKVRVWGQGVEK